MKRAGYLSGIAAVLLFAFLSYANVTVYVDVNGPNDPGTGSFTDPFLRIQQALDAAGDGDTIEIRLGVYTGPGNYNLDPDGKAVTIRSVEPNSSGIVASTVIDPNRAGRGFIIQSGEDANCVISGLTIRNGKTEIGFNGAGIYCYDSSPTIRNCVIKNNHAIEGSGGGICFDYGIINIIDCSIIGNIADYYGGGISSNFASPVIIGCTITGNTALLEGGGVDSGMSDSNIFNCVIVDNNSSLGGGINCYYPGAANVVSCTIAGNSSDYIGGGVHCWVGSNAMISNSILWANSAPEGTQLGLQQVGIASITYCDVQNGQTDIYDPCGLLAWGDGNIDADPCFAIFDPNGDPNLWDLHLKSIYGRWNPAFYKIDFNKDEVINLIDFAALAGVWMKEGIFDEDLNNNGTIDITDLELFVDYYLAKSREDGWLTDASTSPCIDAGDPNSDFSGESWPHGMRVNMGAYGGTNQASRNGNPADFDVSGEVNLVDFAGLAGRWMMQGGFIEDLSGNDEIDYADVSIFAENWLWQRD